jgi:hypothetical protein
MAAKVAAWYYQCRIKVTTGGPESFAGNVRLIFCYAAALPNRVRPY